VPGRRASHGRHYAPTGEILVRTTSVDTDHDGQFDAEAVESRSLHPAEAHYATVPATLPHGERDR